VIPLDEMVAKVRVAVDARTDPNFLIIARTDARGGHGFDEAVRRGQAYAAAGADIVFVEALHSEDGDAPRLRGDPCTDDGQYVRRW
jgi:2-methylisocitrate lyase-like PEP mutase family enzyme